MWHKNWPRYLSLCTRKYIPEYPIIFGNFTGSVRPVRLSLNPYLSSLDSRLTADVSLQTTWYPLCREISDYIAWLHVPSIIPTALWESTSSFGPQITDLIQFVVLRIRRMIPYKIQHPFNDQKMDKWHLFRGKNMHSKCMYYIQHIYRTRARSQNGFSISGSINCKLISYYKVFIYIWKFHALIICCIVWPKLELKRLLFISNLHILFS